MPIRELPGVRVQVFDRNPDAPKRYSLTAELSGQGAGSSVGRLHVEHFIPIDKQGFGDRIDPPLEFVLEFKKMKSQAGANASRLAYCRDGMYRFVEAVYARDEELGFMVALVASEDDLPGVLDGLKRAIRQPDMARLLRSITNPKGKTTLTVSDRTFMPCDFETRHARDHKGQRDVVLGHIMLAHQPRAA